MSDEKYPDDKLLLNARKPQGELGNVLIDDMNVNHEALVQWSLDYLDISRSDVILDVGCGGGVNVERFLKMTDNEVLGIDYSELCVERSIELNKVAIDDERCRIIRASVSNIPFDDNSFDIVTAFETVYFWPDFVDDLKEIRRVLKRNGIIFIANEALPNDDERQRHIIDLLDMNIYSKEELVESLRSAGFENITCHIKESKDSFTGDDATWICVTAQKI